MVAHTTLLEFTLPSGAGVGGAQKVVEEHLGGLGFTVSHTADVDGFLVHFQGKDSSHATARGYPDGLVTVDLTERVPEVAQPKFTAEVVAELEAKIKESTKSPKSQSFPAIRRGDPVPCYFPTTDGKLIEYDFTERVFEEDSEYQNVKIMHSPQFGNVLILDNDPNLAESDLSYTHAITGHGHEDYRDKTVLILGGGDGGILHELLKENPKFITMVDIDGVVVHAAPKHLRGICYDSLDKLKGDNYEVLIEDCVPILEKYVEEGQKFDYVINDLTAIPVTTKPIGDQWEFLFKILKLSMAVMGPHSKYYTQGNGANMTSALAMYEQQLQKLPEPVDFKTQKVFVPSYHEQWVFYEIWKKSS